MELQIWVLTGVVTTLSAILMIVLKVSLQRLISRLDKLIDEVRGLTETVSTHKSEIENLITKNNEQDKRLNVHSERIRDLEINRSKK